MAKPISEGDVVLCRFYNVPERKFYGDTFKAEVLSVATFPLDLGKERHEYLVSRHPLPPIWLHRNEIKRRIA